MTIDIVQINVLLLLGIVAFGSLAISYLFMLKIKRARGKGIDQSTFIGICIFYFFGWFHFLSFFYYFYFDSEFGLSITELYKFASLLGYIGILGLVFFTEKVAGKTKFAFTILSIVAIIIGIIIPFTIEEINVFSSIILPFMLLGFFINFIILLIIRVTKEIRRKMLICFFLIMGMVFSYILFSWIGRALFPGFGGYTTIIGLVGLLATFLGMAKVFLSFETFTEFGWKEKMRELFIIAPNGVQLLHHSFIEDSQSETSDLVSAGLTGVQAILAEMVQSKQKLKVVDHQDVKVLFEYGTYSTSALIVYENLKIYRSKLTSLTRQFEQLFQDVLLHWTGDVEVFHPAKQLIDNIFG